MSHYEYVHRAGYGRDDHMAGELIARAARQLGLDGAERYIAAAAGFASHSVPQGSATVRLPVGRGVRARMQRALREARKEFRSYVDCAVVVVKCRVVLETEHSSKSVMDPYTLRYAMRQFAVRVRLEQEWRGGQWVTVSRTELAQ